MDETLLTEEAKARVPKGYRDALESMARERHLKVADVVREAIREYLERHQPAVEAATV